MDGPRNERVFETGIGAPEAVGVRVGWKGEGLGGTHGHIEHTKGVSISDFGTDSAIRFKDGIPGEFVFDVEGGIPVGDIFRHQEPKTQQRGGPLNNIKIKLLRKAPPFSVQHDGLGTTADLCLCAFR